MAHRLASIIAGLSSALLTGCLDTSLTVSSDGVAASLGITGSGSFVAGTCTAYTLHYTAAAGGFGGGSGTATSPITVSLGTSGAGTFYADSSCAIGSSTRVIPTGSATATYYFSGNTADLEVMTASASNLSAGSLAVSITASTTPPSITYFPSSFTFIQNASVGSISPGNTGGAPTSCPSSPLLPSGLNISSACVITGAATGTQASSNYTITPTNSAGTGTGVVVSIKVNPPVPNITYSPASLVFTQNISVGSITPTNTGGAPTSCASSPLLPSGLNISSTCVITGAATATQAANNYTITPTNVSGNGAGVVISITINPPVPNITYSPASLVFTQNISVGSITPTNTGGTPTSCSPSIALPTGLNLSPTCVITGTPSGTQTSTNYTITPTNAGGSGSGFVISITVNPPVPNITYSPAALMFTQNVSVGSITPTNSGGAAASCSPSITLPTGLTLSPTCVITGTPSATQTSTNYTITPTNAGGSGSGFVISITINPPVPNITYSPAALTFTQNISVGSITPTNSGGTATSCSPSIALPTGLTLSPTCVITGTPSIVQTSTNYTITPTNTGGSGAGFVISITVNPPVPNITYSPAALTFTQNASVGSITPTNSGGAATSCSPSITLPTGLTLSPACVITGTPSAPQTSTNYTITPTNTGGSGSGFVISITVNASGIVISDGPTYNYGTFATGSSNAHNFWLTNVGATAATGLAPTALSAPYSFVGGYPGFGGTCGTTLAAGVSCKIVVTYAPTSTGTQSMTLAMNYNNGSAGTATRDLTGTATAAAVLAITDHLPVYYTLYGIPADPATFDFGSTGTSLAPKTTFYVTNNGAATATSLAPSAQSAPYSYGGGGTCGATLAVGATCSVTVVFAPTSTATFPGSFAITYNDGVGTPTVTRPITGTGVASAVLTIYDYDDNGLGINSGPAYDYGVIGTGQPSDHSFLVVNTGGGTANSLGAGSLPTSFAYKGGSFPGGTLGTRPQDSHSNYCGSSLNAGSSCSITVTFNPSSSISYSGNLGVSYNNGSAQTATRPIAGEGTSYAKLQITEFNNGGGPGDVTDWGYAGVSTTQPKTFIVTNVGAQMAAVISGSVALPFKYSGGTFPGGSGTFNGVSFCTSALAVGASCLLGIEFDPTSSGNFGYTLDLSYADGSGTAHLLHGLTGKGTTLAVISMSNCTGNCGGGGSNPSYDFGSVPQGATRDVPFFITNSGPASATLADGGTLSAPFSYTGGSYPGGSGSTTMNGSTYNFCGSSLAGGATCLVQVHYLAPAVNASQSGTFTLNYLGGTATTSSGSSALTATSTNQAIMSFSTCSGNCGGGGGGTPTYDMGYVASFSTRSTFFYVTNSGATPTTVTDATNFGTTPFFYPGGYPGGTPGTASVVGPNYCPASGGTLSPFITCVIQVNYTAPGSTTTSNITVSLTYGAMAQPNSGAYGLAATSTSQAIVTLMDSPFGGGGGNNPFNFGTWGVGTDYVFMVQNSGSVATTITDATGAGWTGGFSYTTGSFPGGSGSTMFWGSSYPFCGGTLPASGLCAISVHFAPSGSGTTNATVSLNASGAVIPNVSRSMTATSTTRAHVLISDNNSPFSCGDACGPNSWGTQSITGSNTRNFTIYNTGAQIATGLGDGGLAGGGAFSWPSGVYPGTGGTCGSALPQGATCQIAIKFAPSSITTYNGTINISNSDGGGALPNATRNLKGDGGP